MMLKSIIKSLVVQFIGSNPAFSLKEGKVFHFAWVCVQCFCRPSLCAGYDARPPVLVQDQGMAVRRARDRRVGFACPHCGEVRPRA